MSRVEVSQIQALKDQGMNYADIGKSLGVSREWIRRLAGGKVVSRCKGCHAEVGSREKWCADCREQKRKAAGKKYAKATMKSFSKRPVVIEAYRFFAGLGMDVILNAEAKRSEPELLVNGHGVKCNVMVPVSKGHQCRLRPNKEAEWLYLSDGDYRPDHTVFVIPSSEVQKPKTYIGEKSELRRYLVSEWGYDGLREVLA